MDIHSVGSTSKLVIGKLKRFLIIASKRTQTFYVVILVLVVFSKSESNFQKSNLITKLS